MESKKEALQKQYEELQANFEKLSSELTLKIQNETDLASKIAEVNEKLAAETEKAKKYKVLAA